MSNELTMRHQLAEIIFGDFLVERDDQLLELQLKMLKNSNQLKLWYLIEQYLGIRPVKQKGKFIYRNSIVTEGIRRMDTRVLKIVLLAGINKTDLSVILERLSELVDHFIESNPEERNSVRLQYSNRTKV